MCTFHLQDQILHRTLKVPSGRHCGVASEAATRRATSCIRVPVQDPAKLQLVQLPVGVPWKTAGNPRSETLPPMWGTQMVFQAPGFCLTQFWHSGHLRSESANGRSFSLSPPVCLSKKKCVSQKKLSKTLKKKIFLAHQVNPSAVTITFYISISSKSNCSSISNPASC